MKCVARSKCSVNSHINKCKAAFTGHQTMSGWYLGVMVSCQIGCYSPVIQSNTNLDVAGDGILQMRLKSIIMDLDFKGDYPR